MRESRNIWRTYSRLQQSPFGQWTRKRTKIVTTSSCVTCFSFPFYTRSLAAKISAKRPEAVTSPLATRLPSWKGPLQNHCVCPRRIDMGWERTGSRNQMKASLWEAAFWASASTNWIQCLTIPPTQTTHWGRVQHILLQNRICFQANSIFNLLS